MINNSFNEGDLTINSNQDLFSDTKLLENELSSEILSAFLKELESIGNILNNQQIVKQFLINIVN